MPPLFLLALLTTGPRALSTTAEPPAHAQPRTSVSAAASAPELGKGAWHALRLPKGLTSLLQTGQWDATPRSFRIIALSFLADACLGQAERDTALRTPARACVARVAELARATQPSGFAEDPLGYGLWATHFALILGAADQLGACLDPHAHEAVARRLAAASLGEPTFHVASYPREPRRWPADQSATLAALHRYDLAHASAPSNASRPTLGDEPARKWRAFIEKEGIDPRSALPVSEVSGKRAGAREPRGCALSFQLRYVHEFDAPLATGWWARYRKVFLSETFLLVGFREWPPGKDRPADLDSGPIVNGIGTAASALGIATAFVLGDRALGKSLAFAAETALRFAPASARKAADTHLAAAILFLGEHPPRNLRDVAKGVAGGGVRAPTAR